VPIYVTVLLEFREVVDKGGVNHGIRRGCSTAEAFRVFKITPMNLGTSGGQRLGARI
jgi:hypothetical protein